MEYRRGCQRTQRGHEFIGRSTRRAMAVQHVHQLVASASSPVERFALFSGCEQALQFKASLPVRAACAWRGRGG